MAPNLSIISINGKKYDARTGKLLNGAQKASINSKKNHSGQGQIMDGVIRRPAHNPVKTHQHNYKQGSLDKPTVHHNAKPAKAIHHRTIKSKTLFRVGLKQPNATLINNISKSSAKPTQQTHGDYKATGHQPKLDEERLKRAEEVAKSSQISKFSKPSSHRTVSQQVTDKQESVVSGEVIMPGDAKPEPRLASNSTEIARTTKGSIDDLVDHALATATAHKQKKPKQHRRAPKFASAMAILLVVVLLGGFFAYQYIPNFAMRVASERAGVDGSIPGYQASGFSFDSIDISPGTVEVNYVANADDSRLYSVMQKNSNWDSQSLLNDFVKREDSNSQSSHQDKGKTIYIYDNHNATWVSGGIWYVINGENADLSVDQLLRIASSI